jgi:hypothetical protein
MMYRWSVENEVGGRRIKTGHYFGGLSGLTWLWQERIPTVFV